MNNIGNIVVSQGWITVSFVEFNLHPSSDISLGDLDTFPDKVALWAEPESWKSKYNKQVNRMIIPFEQSTYGALCN